MDNTQGIRLSDGHTLTPEEALAFLSWLHPHMPDLPHAIATWLAQQHQHQQQELPTHDLPPLEPYCVVERSPLDGCYHIVDFGLDLP